MKQHLNTLYVSTQGAYLAKDGAAVAVRIEKKVRLRLPLHNLDGIVCFGRVGASPSLLAACAEAGVSVSFMSIYGKMQARVLGFTPGNVLLRRQQYRMSDSPEASLGIARSMIAAKIANCRTTLLRSARDTKNPEKEASLRDASDRLKRNLFNASRAESLDSLRGIEGESASAYFSAFNAMLIDDTNLILIRSPRCLKVNQGRGSYEPRGLKPSQPLLPNGGPGRGSYEPRGLISIDRQDLPGGIEIVVAFRKETNELNPKLNKPSFRTDKSIKPIPVPKCRLTIRSYTLGDNTLLHVRPSGF